MKTIEQFYNEAKDNKELQAALQEAMEKGTTNEFLKAHQVSVTLADIEAFVKAHAETGELSDDELEAVSGGVIEWGSYGEVTRRSDLRFEFNIGDRVEVYNGWFFATFTKRATVIDRTIEVGSGTCRPRYQVKYDNPSKIRGKTLETSWVDQDHLSY